MDPDDFQHTIRLCHEKLMRLKDHDLPPNAWFLELAASVGHTNPVREFMRVATHPQEWAIWHRRNSFEPHAYLWHKLARRVGLGGTTSVSSTAERGMH